MAKTIDLKINIDAAGNAKSGIANIASSVGKLGTIAAGVATGGLLLAAGGVVALGKGLFDSVGAAMEAQEGQAQLAAVLKSTGGAAGMTAESVNALASQFQAITPFEDDAILAGQNLLLTFTNIGKDVFPLATEAMLNMATALGTDASGSAIQLGKALNDPVAGITALTRVGVTFSEEQKKAIAALVETGDVAGAQQIILAELNKEFGGSAVAAGETLPGKLAILKNTFGDIQETIGAALLPALSSIADAFSSGLKSEFVQNALAGLVSFITGTVVPGFDTIVMQVGAMIAAFRDGGLLAAFAVFEDGSSRIGALAEVFGLSEEAGIALGQTINEIVSKVGMIITAFQDGGLLEAFMVFDDGSSRVSAMAEVLGLSEESAFALGATIQSVAQFITDAMVIWNEWSSHLNETTGPAMVLIQDALDRISTAMGGASVEFDLGAFALDLLKGTLDAVTIAIQLVALGMQGAALVIEGWAATIRTVRGLVDGFRSAMNTLASGVSSAVSSIAGAFGRMAAAARKAIDSIPKWLRPGSPTPFEIGLRGIASAADKVGSRLPGAFATSSIAPGLSFSGATPSFAGASAAGGLPIVIHYSPVVSTAGQIEIERNLIPLIIDGLRKAGVKVG